MIDRRGSTYNILPPSRDMIQIVEQAIGAGYVAPQNPFQEKSTVRVKRVQKDGQTYVLCVSSGGMEKDKAIRQTQQERFLQDVGKPRKRIQGGRLMEEGTIHQAIGRIYERYPRVAGYYHVTYDREHKELLSEQDEDRLEKAVMLDDSYLLKTDRMDLTIGVVTPCGQDQRFVSAFLSTLPGRVSFALRAP